MLCLRASPMQTLSALLLLAGAASTIAFTPHGRQRRGVAGAGAGAGASAGAFATSGAYGGGGGGAGGFAFPGASSYGPSAFESAFRSYFDQMEALLAAQQAHAQALSNRFWGEWRNTMGQQAEAAQLAANSVYAGSPPNYYYHYGTPQASHSHSSISFFPHRFNAASANAIPTNDVNQVYSGVPSQEGSTHYASVSSGGPGGQGGTGFGFGGSYGGGPAASFAGVHGGGVDAGGPAGQSGYSGAGGADSHVGSSLGGAAQGAQASLAVSNRGGFGAAQLFPDPGLASRISGDIAPLSGGAYGVFSSSSSSSHSDPSGKTHTTKQATVGVNDNGKVTTFSVKDP